MVKHEQLLFGDHKNKENVQQKFILLQEICGPILGIYKSLTDTCMWKLGMRPRNTQKGIQKWDFSCSVSVRFRIGWKAFLLRGRAWHILKRQCIEIIFCCVQERVNSFPPPAARSPPVSVTEFQPPYFPPPFSTASMALQQATQLSTWIGLKIKKHFLMWRIDT